ncbi:lipooligosaccharide transport system, ABC transporter permease component LptG [Campylobacter blaseri]|uniref:Permease n=1 Tax=Campylobacter blaseri TaxID=2042961 RepID=A0A2P8R156_9BACT|nr:LptF/LptG family permease [Campylobacter blaseri]PSM52230.1 permease [Campylobacter blaseri]PSM53996.1 permease [Campylobacter blaseri]QKF85434.1 lipooligosaccharide transport system, ABC transporter permease component LptG [Campylobacter blaseri]
MPKLYSRYLAIVYLKYFFILFIALEFFYVSIDILTNLKDFPKSANLAVLYLLFTAASAIAYILPLSLIFAMIIAKINMIRSNELVSLYSLGVSKIKLIRTPFFISLVITFIYVYSNTTGFAYVDEYRNNLENFNNIGKVSNSMFLKYENKYIYIKRLNSQSNAASDIRILSTNKDNLETITFAKKANYDSEKWSFFDVNLVTFPSDLKLGAKGLKQEKKDKFYDLKGFNPSSIEKIYNKSNTYSIKDAISSIKTFKNQGINIDGIKANLYSLIFTPFFAPIMVVILFFYLPATGRFFNIAFLSFIFFITTLCLWGVLFILTRFSLTGVIAPEIGIIMPIILLAIFSVCLLFKKN